MVISLVGVGLALILLGVIFLITRLELWLQVWAGFGELGAVGLALWGLVVIVVLAAISFLAFRRAKP